MSAHAMDYFEVRGRDAQARRECIERRETIAKLMHQDCQRYFVRYGLCWEVGWPYSTDSIYECGTLICRGCEHQWPSCAMVDKVPGARCPLCAHAYELELLGVRVCTIGSPGLDFVERQKRALSPCPSYVHLSPIAGRICENCKQPESCQQGCAFCLTDIDSLLREAA